ncbi:ubiquitin carboxyl-terminal hydrolase CYLD isoform X1 [Hydra vulgaris]|uniref:ubiquitin carboxyl-terminal hydrolase CYLD isoform X1 n=1 Tax=Hydra vulgaris TaxID=6087 RepID=UPI001F5E7FEC|nr:ubiquitin carboxyl-terminal hydrolase CYLD [Hydra vulgaris]
MDLETGEKHFYILIEKLPNIKNNSIQFIAAGTLLVEQKKYGKQENKKKVITIDDQTEIEVNLSSVYEISEDEFFLLVAVSSKEKCLKAFNNQENLRLAISAKGGTNVEVITEFGTITGMLIYKGPIDRLCGTYFGVLFKVPYGNCNGLPHFTCEKNHGIYVAIDQISFCETNKNPLSKLKPMKKHKNEQKEVHLVSADNKFIGMRVSCNVSGQNNLLKGSIRYIGNKQPENLMFFGIKLDEKPSKPIEKMFEDYTFIDCPQDLDYFTTDMKSLMFNSMSDSIIPKENENISFVGSYLDETEINKKLNDMKKNDEVLSKKKNELSTANNYKNELNQNMNIRYSEPNPENMYYSIEDDFLRPYEAIPRNVFPESHNIHEVSKERFDADLNYDDMYFDEHNQQNKELNKQPLNSSLQENDLVVFQVSGNVYNGILRWKGFVPQVSHELAGIELDDLNPYLVTTNGTFNGRQLFKCSNGKAYFVKLSSCKPDSRFQGSAQQSKSHSKSQSVSGYHPPPNKLGDKYIGNMKGIQGHINSCYMDATLFAMFAFNSTFDFMLYQKSCKDDFGDNVQKCLHLNIVNPLRVNGFVEQPSIMELRKCLDNIGEIAGFLDKEKDPEEFLTILLEKVLKVEPFMTLRTHNQEDIGVYLYQIIADINPLNPQPSIQYLMELSFISNKSQLLKVPSVMMIQVPRFGLNKIFNRIQITPTLDLSPFLLDAQHFCIICGNSSSCYCKNCVCEFGWNNVYTYLCQKCSNIVHSHNKRHDHELVELSSFSPNVSEPFVPNTKALTTMELFAVICIKTSHYVSFVKCGEGDEASWVFFDSMADRHGDHDGYNIPKVIEIPKLKDFLMASPLDISNIKKEEEYALRLYEDASLCFYRNTQMSMYT